MRPRTCPGEPRPEGQRSSLVGVLVTAGVLAALELVLVVWSAALVLARLARGDVTAQLGPFASASEIAVTRARFDLDRSPGGQCIVWASRAVRIDCQACGAGRWRLLSRYLPAGGTTSRCREQATRLYNWSHEALQRCLHADHHAVQRRWRNRRSRDAP